MERLTTPILFLLMAAVLSIFPAVFADAADSNVDARLYIGSEMACNNNGVCEPERGESAANCPLDCPNIPSSSASVSSLPGQLANIPLIYNLTVSNITLSSAEISWRTDIISRCQISYGRRSDYELGTVAETSLAQGHKARLGGLDFGTNYHFKITCFNVSFKQSETGDQQFSTLTPPDITTPANVSDFTATPGKKDIALDWKNPKTDFAGVEIVRRDDFYPSDPRTGKVVYDGLSESFVDSDVVVGKRYYYAAFSYDKSGNYSSGALATAIISEPGEPESPLEIPEVAAPPEIEKINIDRFDFIQNGKKIEVSGGKVSVSRLETFTVSIPYQSVPEVLKTIMVTLKQGDKLFSFLLRINKGKTAYEATLVPPDSGTYPLTITILDYKNQAFKKIQGELIVMKAQASQTQIIQYTLIRKLPPIFYVLFVLIMAYAGVRICRVMRKRREKFKIK